MDDLLDVITKIDPWPSPFFTFRRTPDPEEDDRMPLFQVAFTLVPNKKAQEAGAEETLLVPPTPVCAKDATSAIARVAADNATKIQGTDGSTLKSHVSPFQTVV
jgi:hypothetical protein